MSALQYWQSFLHKNQKFFITFCQWLTQTKQYWRNAKISNSVTWIGSQNPNSISMSVQNVTKKYAHILLNFSTIEIPAEAREYLIPIELKLKNEDGEV